MSRSERRRAAPPDPVRLRQGLTRAQADAIATLEALGWELRFVRRPLFADPIPIVFEKAGARWLVVEGDGRLNESPGFALRE
ncbi:hypothetical protein [Luteimonas sp. FCS-9]|uniref:hypothetical protein n=1 Tax=Luteimonas sp. FCS-9 TaxID=1547516 RepID=UPI00063E866E|nr:hypothetical protein [Luteimonas sp. FCS-9]KLI97700.1 hypothetical protein WQ56_16585 [Luteimonas sp. FCS-9]